ncbi:MAG: VWA domain-containing protein [Terrimicrobiaceae bacterium]
MISLIFPSALLLLPLAGVIVYFSRTSLAQLARRSAGVALGLRLFIFASLVVALAQPVIRSASLLVHHVVVIDVSDSMGGAAMEAAGPLLEALAGKQHTIVEFAGNARVARAGGEESTPPLTTDATRISNALLFAEAGAPPDRGRVITLFSDGVVTTPESPLAPNDSTIIHTMGVAPPVVPEVALSGVEFPPLIRSREPFEATARVVSTVETSAVVDLLVDGLVVATRNIKLVPGTTSVPFVQSLEGSRSARISVVVKAPSDTRPTNNRLDRAVTADGTGGVLRITGHDSRELDRALREQGIDVESREPVGLPDTDADYDRFDAVILDDVSPDDLPEAAAFALARAVREGGLGLVALGSEKVFAPTVGSGKPVSELLPMETEFFNQREWPTVALLLLIDTSGSMTGEKMDMARSAAKEAIRLLTPEDSAGVIGFQTDAGWAAPLQPASDFAALSGGIDVMRAGGGTNIAPALDLALQALRGNRARLRHVILLSDGISTPGPLRELARSMTSAGITLSTVAFGRDADLRLMEELAREGGGRSYFTDSPANLPRIFAKETLTATKPSRVEAPFIPQVVRPAPFLRGISWESPLLGHAITRAKPGADVWLTTESGQPLLATWTKGVGHVAAFASDAREVWASEWVAWSQFGTFWAQLIREVSKPGSLRTFPVSTETVEEGWKIRLDAVTPRGSLLPEPGAFLTGMDGSTLARLELTAPGSLETTLPIQPGNPLPARLNILSGDRVAASIPLDLSARVPAEHIPCPPDFSHLRQIAANHGGVFQPSVADILASRPAPVPAPTPLWQWFAWAALVAFLAELAIRRGWIFSSAGRRPA